jgi:hypothetical protein
LRQSLLVRYLRSITNRKGRADVRGCWKGVRWYHRAQLVHPIPLPPPRSTGSGSPSTLEGFDALGQICDLTSHGDGLPGRFAPSGSEPPGHLTRHAAGAFFSHLAGPSPSPQGRPFRGHPLRAATPVSRMWRREAALLVTLTMRPGLGACTLRISRRLDRDHPLAPGISSRNAAKGSICESHSADLPCKRIDFAVLSIVGYTLRNNWLS